MSSFKSGSGTWILCLGSDGSSGLGPLGIRLVCVLCDGFEASGVAGAGSITGSANSFCCLLSSETCRSDFGLHSCHSSFSTFNSSRQIGSLWRSRRRFDNRLGKQLLLPLVVRNVPLGFWAPQLPLKLLDLQLQQAVELAQLLVFLLKKENEELRELNRSEEHTSELQSLRHL